MRRSLLAIGTALLLCLASSAQVDAPAEVQVVAHRCNTGGYTENTQIACVKAAASGADVLDVDVRWTRTGLPVLLHDPTMGIFGAPTVRIDSLSHPEAAKYLSPTFDNITTLTQLRDTAVATGATVVLEPKVTMTAGRWQQIFDRFDGIRERTIIDSYSPAVLQVAFANGYQTRLNVLDSVTSVPAWVEGIVVPASKINAEHVAALLGQEVETWCDHAPDATAWQACLNAGAGTIVTDNHVALQQWLEER